MRIHRLDANTIALSRIDEFVAGLLQRLVPSSDSGGSAAAEERLFPSPTRGDEPEFVADWKSYVEPDLRAQFRTAVETVEADLTPFRAATLDFPMLLRIPLAHLGDWVNTLNQARLALAARHAVTEEDMEEDVPAARDERALALFLIHFYGYLQESFLKQAGGL